MSARTSSRAPLLQPWKPQLKLYALVKALWRVLYPACKRPHSFELWTIFAQLSRSGDTAAKTLYTNYFDPVITRLPHGKPCSNRYYNLRLSCFDSWADLEKEKERGRERNGQLFFPTAHHSSGLRSSRLAQYRSRGATSGQQLHNAVG